MQNNLFSLAQKLKRGTRAQIQRQKCQAAIPYVFSCELLPPITVLILRVALNQKASLAQHKL